jgi:hypothetical protein
LKTFVVVVVVVAVDVMENIAILLTNIAAGAGRLKIYSRDCVKQTST